MSRDVENELLSILSNELAKSIDTEIIRTFRELNIRETKIKKVLERLKQLEINNTNE